LLALWATVGQAGLPTLIEPTRFGVAHTISAAAIWALRLVGEGALWGQRPHSVLDLWLSVSLVAWSFDVALSSLLNAAR
jgi:two-component system sensor histidine kinase/response regulator